VCGPAIPTVNSTLDRSRRRRSRPHDRGQATPLVAVALLLAGVATLALVAHGGRVVDAARARTAADAAALAGAAEGRTAADRLAEANGGRITAYRAEGRDVVVAVVVGGATARARASRDGTWCGSTGSGIPYTPGPCPSSPG
jgi:hypothetical protein